MKENARNLALQAAQAAIDNNALEPVLLDTSKQSSYADFILVLSGRSARQVEAIAEKVEEALKDAGHSPLSVEGERGGHWTLIDYGDVVIHVFFHPTREYYDLEGLWSDAPQVPLQVPPELRVANTYIY